MRGIIGALRVRDLYGRGQWVQTSIVQTLASPHDNNVGDGGLVNMQLRRRDPERFPGRPGGSRGLSSIGYVPVRTKDGTWLQHANQRVPHIQGHLKAIGLGHLLEDERFEKVPAIDLENRELLRREILNKQLEKTADEWMEIYLQDGNIAAEPYRDSVQAMDHPAVVSNGTVVTINDPRVGPMRTLAPLVDFKDTPGEPSGPAPDVGQHNAEVLGRLRQPYVAVSGGLPEANGADVATHPLSGVTILDLATVQAGPYGAALLADLGARVIKIDATDRRLDEGRRSTAQAVADPRTYAGKEGIQVDLQTPEGKEIVHKAHRQGRCSVAQLSPRRSGASPDRLGDLPEDQSPLGPCLDGDLWRKRGTRAPAGRPSHSRRYYGWRHAADGPGHATVAGTGHGY